MAYCTKADLERRFHPENIRRWASNDGHPGLDTAEEANITAAISDADTVIDAKLAVRYAVPFSPVPALVNYISICVTGYNLARRKGFAAAGGANQGASIVGDRDEALRLLDQAAAGEISLHDASEASDAIASTTEDAEPVFSRSLIDTAAGTVIDDDLDHTLDAY